MRIKESQLKVIYVLLAILVLNVNYSLLYLESDYYFMIVVLTMLSALALMEFYIQINILSKKTFKQALIDKYKFAQ